MKYSLCETRNKILVFIRNIRFMKLEIKFSFECDFRFEKGKSN